MCIEYRMPSIARSSKWFVRVDGNRDYLADRCKEITGWIDCDKILSLYHVGESQENPHIHFVLELTSELQKQSLDVRIKKLFKIDKKSNYSSKVWDGGESACSYMFHESDVNIVCNKGFSEEQINRFKELNESVQRVVAINRARAPGRQADRVVEEFREENSTPDRRDIFGKFMDKIRNGEMYEPGDYQLMKLVEEVYMKLRHPDQWDDYVDERYHKLFLRN